MDFEKDSFTSEEERLNPGHKTASSLMKVIGPLITGVGAILIAIGLGSFFSSASSFSSGPPRYFWCVFLGMPTLFVGIVISKFAYVGTVLRYMSAESAPVAKDTFNYMADGTKEGVRDIAGAIREGILGSEDTQLVCPSCQCVNDVAARFCDQCGQPISIEKDCSVCQTANEADSKFCDSCGSPFSTA